MRRKNKVAVKKSKQQLSVRWYVFTIELLNIRLLFDNLIYAFFAFLFTSLTSFIRFLTYSIHSYSHYYSGEWLFYDHIKILNQ